MRAALYVSLRASLTAVLVRGVLAAAQSSSLSLPSELYSSSIGSKILAIANKEPAPPTYPQYTDRSQGTWQYFNPNTTWTTGFFPATLYAMHTRQTLCPSENDNTDWVTLGRSWSTGIIPFETHNGLEHDVGFVSFPFQEELQINPQNSTAITAVENFANDLAARFSPIVGCTRSWDTSDPTNFEVIIDNMMNLEVLFQAASLNNNDTLRQIAISHADKTMTNHVRPDGSSFHVVEYNSTTGQVIARITSQGFADNSTWSRGQAWGIYGFATMYQNTNLSRYLDTSREMATYFLNNMPSDGIVPWDFNAPLNPPRPADTSAATIAATGLLLLSRLEQSLSPPNTTGSNLWTNFAAQLLTSTAQLAWKPDWQSLLSNGTVNNRANPPNNLTGIVYGDYYFVKAGNDLVQMGLAQCNSSNASTTTASSSTHTSTSHASKSTSSGCLRLPLLTIACLLALLTSLRL
ncbi:Six-hairpin glycosidase [Schizopora paradoxa]|uniref:Six-hairpin glycosidase n=1 Tax=Schizopora paradoxa TaxID=27342 RepID=A0A0H2RGF5_9AGAM|nr:Six-hairpin glycosidase [Schizopora paradoxa]